MRLRTLWTLLCSGRLRLLGAASRHATSFYRVAWLAGASRGGLLARLARGPVTFERLVAELAPAPGGRDALAAFLETGRAVGELAVGADGWRLHGTLARGLADPENDPVAALLEEAATLHHALLGETLARLAQGRPWTLADQDGEVIARSSRVLEPALCDAIDRLFPSGPVRLLEVGCGSGVYIRHAAARNPALTAIGLELQPDVAAMATRNLRTWAVDDRARIEQGDVRQRIPERAFDVVTLHNNVYYFPVDERVALLRHLRGFLRPGGRLVLTTGCRGGSVSMHVLDLWGATTAGCGRLPDVAELEDQMRAAGLTAVRALRLVPGESFYAFVGIEPSRA